MRLKLEQNKPKLILIFRETLRMRIFTSISLLLLLFSCSKGQRAMDSSFSLHFQPMNIGDTLFFSMTSPEGLQADSISLTEFEMNVDSAQRNIIDYILDEELTNLVGLNRFPLSDEYEAYIIGATMSWYGNQSLLIVNKKYNYVTALIPVSQFYGGEGGQVLRNSWLFDYDGDGDKDLVIRDSAHALRVNEQGDEEETYDEYVSLYFWESKGFKPAAVNDSTALIQRFPVNWDW